MQRLAIVLAACAVGACATRGPTGELPDRTDVSLGRPGGAPARNLTLTREPSTGDLLVDASLTDSWAALESVLDRNELPVAESDRRAGRMIVRGQVPRLGGERMSHWFDCGVDPSGPVADRARITAVLGYQLRALTEARTIVSWALQAEARPRFNPDNRIACTPRQALHDFLRDQLAGGGV
ncbi:MAG TPA: hypothetical protein VK858_16475 [Longimicrobiales bacterium]|nr:hypothetical protein [Longimicrobiales bacterium]